MEHFGLWGIIPPLLTIVLAFITKDVIVSLFLGILSGALIVAGGNPGTALMTLTDLVANSLADGLPSTILTCAETELQHNTTNKMPINNFFITIFPVYISLLSYY